MEHQITKDEVTIFDWLEQHPDNFKHLSKNEISINLYSDENAWNAQSMPQNIVHPTNNFLSSPALVLKYQYDHEIPLVHEDSIIPQEYLVFDSTPGKPIERSLTDQLAITDPFTSIVSPNDFHPIFDSRPENTLINSPNLEYVSFEFDVIKSMVDFISPIVLTMYVFDAKNGRRVSDHWTFVPPQFREQLKSALKCPMSSESDFSYIFDSPSTASFALKRPKESNDEESLTDGLFLMLILDRPFMTKGGAAINYFYENPKDGYKKKALLAASEMYPPGFLMTFAYGAIPIKELYDKKEMPETVTFDKIILTNNTDEAFFQHKLQKVRKNPKYLPFYAQFRCCINNPTENCDVLLSAGSSDKGLVEDANKIMKIIDFFPTRPYFSLKYENILVIKMKKVVLNMKLGMKGRNIVAKIACFDGDKQINIINGGRYQVKTRCQYHCTNPSFQEDLVINLPYPVTPSMYINFQFINITAKKKGSINKCGEANMNIMLNNLIRPNGEHRIPVNCDPKLIDPKSDTKSYIIVDIHLKSTLNTQDPIIMEMLNENFQNIKRVSFESLVPFLHPILDIIFKQIREMKKEGFDNLLNIIDMFPINTSDGRYEKFSARYDGIFVQPYDHLNFYAKYASLRNIEIEPFFSTFLTFWLDISEQPMKPNRSDIISCPFLFDILLKCIFMDKNRLYSFGLNTLIKNMQNVIFKFRSTDPAISGIGRRVNHFLSLFYKDLMEFADRGFVFDLMKCHLLQFDIRKNQHDQVVFIDFMSSFFSAKSFLYSTIPLYHNDPSSCFFTQYVIPIIEEGLATSNHTQKVFSILFKLLIHFTHEEKLMIIPSLSHILVLFGRNRDIVLMNPNPSDLIFPLIILLFIVIRYDMTKVGHEFGECCRLLLEIADKNKDCPPDLNVIVREVDNFGYKNSSVLKKVLHPMKGMPNVNIRDVWKNFAFISQLICICISLTNQDSIFILSDIIVTFFDIKVSSSLFSSLKKSVIDYLENKPIQIFTSSHSRVYKLIKNIIKNLSPHNIEILETLFSKEKEHFQNTNRCTAFVLRGIRKYQLGREAIPYFEKSEILPLVTEYVDLMKECNSLDHEDINNHEFIADIMLKIANFFLPSPDCRVDQLLELAQFQTKCGYVSEGAVAQLTAAACVAEYLTILGRLPKYVFSKQDHPALAFLAACPTADEEICPDNVMSDLPRIPGFCTSKHFCECGLIFIIQKTMETCKRARLYELSTKVHALLRPLAEYRHLWLVLDKHYQNGSFSWSVLEQFNAKNDRELGSYYRVEFQNGGTYIYRETSYANFWQVSEKLKSKAKVLSDGKNVVVLNDGEDLSSAKIDPNNYYVHVKAVEQYFTPEERKARITVFEQNHNVKTFYFDLPYSKSAQQSIEFLMLKRTIYTVTHTMPYVVSRVPVPPENITREIFTPIEYCIQSLQKQVDKINEAANRGDFNGLQPLIQGSLLTQVNEGPKKMAEVFLNGSIEDKNTMLLRKIFRKFLKANKKAVELHAGWVLENKAFSNLQDELELGLNRLLSTLQPFLK
ncbi:hypothetical protein TRFO_37539 [Tritrichomonas foetus]|uniref:DOCKER domain-containing protein n=1 Tax=Tritrichomonas foetus TaxID=1144522 RepID=A0A1J4JAW3_9EUKA|nr:hypothetical protein TRFO_37539 [Tritrichomonas foetus]|eukprot:OHS96296.1 hypothetical protein TRFO_37539 [Tritrichomonas foetus]